MADDIQFVDPDSEYMNSDKNSYEEIVLNQIRETAKVLSGDLTPVMITNQKTGHSYTEDRRKVAINHVSTLRHLINPFMKETSEEKIALNEIDNEIKEYLNEFGNKKTMVRGKGVVSYKDLVHNAQSIPYQQLMEFKSDKYQLMFGILVNFYKKNKDEIAAHSFE